MAESHFSQQVIGRYINGPFPIYHKSHEDRLYKTVSFYELDADAQYRIHTVDYQWKKIESLFRKTVFTGLTLSDWEKELFRVKAVLSEMDVSGIQESYWLTQHHTDYNQAQKLNQYRVRGITENDIQSDWVYSEIRDDQNDLVLFELIHDLLDIVSMMYDDDLEYLINYITEDAYSHLFRDGDPFFESSILPDETKLAQLRELFSILKSSLNQEFKESLVADKQEFTQILRRYGVLDKIQTTKKDFSELLLEAFFQDKLEKVVQKAELEVITRNSEEVGAWFADSYDFDILAEFLQAIPRVDMTDRFRTNLNDAVKLITEPVVFEKLRVEPAEGIEKFLRLLLVELYVPMLVLDKHLAEVETNLSDDHKQSISEELIEFDVVGDDAFTRYMFLYEVIEELISGDLDIKHDFHAQMLDKMLGRLFDRQQNILIDYHFYDYITMLSSLGESFTQSYKKLFHAPREQVSLQYNEKIDSVSLTKSSLRAELISLKVTEKEKREETILSTPLQESYQMMMQDIYNLKDTTKRKEHLDRVSARLREKVFLQVESSKAPVKEYFMTAWLEQVMGLLTVDSQDIKENLSMSSLELMRSKDSIDIQNFFEQILLFSKDGYFAMYKPNLRDLRNFFVQEWRIFDFATDLSDTFEMIGKEEVLYALGQIGDGFPIGEFVIGTNTLTSDPNNPYSVTDPSSTPWWLK